MPQHRPELTRAYRTVVTVSGPIMKWARMRVTGLDCLPATGPVLLVADHDSYWDPIAVAVAVSKVRQVRAPAQSTIWKNKGVGALMTEMGHIPVERGASNADAMGTAGTQPPQGARIRLFPPGA